MTWLAERLTAYEAFVVGLTFLAAPLALVAGRLFDRSRRWPQAAACTRLAMRCSAAALVLGTVWWLGWVFDRTPLEVATVMVWTLLAIVGAVMLAAVVCLAAWCGYWLHVGAKGERS